jgi:hypothetical protein
MSRSVRTTVQLLQLVAEGEIQADQAERRAALLRQEVERIVWGEQETNPNINRPVVELEMSLAAEHRLPKKAKTVRDLCISYSAADLADLGIEKKYVREIQDLLRAWGLVLKPQN